MKQSIYRLIKPVYWHLLKDEEIKADLIILIKKSRSPEVLNNYLENLRC